MQYKNYASNLINMQKQVCEIWIYTRVMSGVIGEWHDIRVLRYCDVLPKKPVYSEARW
jgi:hypothetical protein